MTHDLDAVARALVADDKGLLAVDESPPTCDRRFAALGIVANADTRRAWRELLVGAPGLGDSISGVILCDETFHQRTSAGAPFAQRLAEAGIAVGIKVDTGSHPLAGHPGEQVTEGLDDLRGRLTAYRSAGAGFAKWRAVIAIGSGTSGSTGDGSLPSPGGLEANAHALARYAALCQEAGLVPVVEPEVLMDGDHTLAQCAEVTEAVLHRVFDQLQRQRVRLEAVLLKPNMVVAGLRCPLQPDADAVADATLTVLRRAVPAAVAGVVFLSGGQPAEAATARLNAINRGRRAPAAASAPPTSDPWPLSFSFARALQQPALDAWRGAETQVDAAQHALLHRVACNRAARRGTWTADTERR